MLCIWRGFKNKTDVCHVLCEEVFKLDGRPHIPKLMLKQSLVWNHWLCWFKDFSFDKTMLSIFQVSIDRERCLTGSVKLVLSEILPCVKLVLSKILPCVVYC